MATPFLVFPTMVLFGLLLGSLGMDIHWNASKMLRTIAVLCVTLILCGSFLAGLRLRRASRHNAS